MKTTGITPAMLRAEGEGRGMMAGAPGAIEASEALGQIELVSNAKLPAEMNVDREAVTKATGIQFGDMADELFINATLPEGWSKRATDHSMHSELVDDRGCVRAGIFYKAAFYDRRADMRFKSFFEIGGDYTKREVRVVNANGNLVKDFGAADREESSDKYYALQDEARVWLDENHPDHSDPFAYWD
ncbi:hypothetical protein LCGC14_2488480 [marine sediment metagenome]|uniref:Uncharacterized protein n=1 Tax=marine sediment metagenome TaxID=412755 RepID=A0A0F9BTD4_9ZZZZ